MHGKRNASWALGVALALCSGCTAPVLLENTHTYLAASVDNPNLENDLLSQDKNNNGVADLHEDLGSAASSPCRADLYTVDRPGDWSQDAANADDGGGYQPYPLWDDPSLTPAVFRDSQVVDFARMQGIEVVRVHRFSRPDSTDEPEGFSPGQQNVKDDQPDDTFIELAYGGRFARFAEYSWLYAYGGVMGETSADSELNNPCIGPQFEARWGINRRAWSLRAGGSVFAGYNHSDWSRSLQMGTDLIPGAHNSPLYLDPIYSEGTLTEEDLSLIGEAFALARYRITERLAVQAVYNLYHFSGVRYSDNWFLIRLPDGFATESDTHNRLVQTAGLFVELTH